MSRMLARIMDTAAVGSLPPDVSVIIDNYTHSIRPCIAFIMIATVFSSLLLLVVAALFYSSTSESRKRPVFVLNSVALFMGLVVGIVSLHLQINLILSPLTGDNYKETIAWNVLSSWAPWISEAILVLRLVAVFHDKSKSTIAAILAFPVCLKVARSIVIVRYLCVWQQETKGPYNPLNVAISTGRIGDGWMLKTEFVLELLDNAYMSGAFLLQLYNLGYSSGIRSSQRYSIALKPSSFRTRLHTLFWIASTNFVFPVVFNVCCIAIMFTTENIIAAGVLNMLNVFTTTVCTVLATVWVQAQEIGQTRRELLNTGHRTELGLHEMKSPPSIMSNIAFPPTKDVMPARKADLSQE